MRVAGLSMHVEFSPRAFRDESGKQFSQNKRRGAPARKISRRKRELFDAICIMTAGGNALMAILRRGSASAWAALGRSRPALGRERVDMNAKNIDGLMRAMELEGTARIDIIRIGKDIQTAGYARRSPSVQQYEELRRAVVQWQRIADDIGRIIGSG
jgi:hypothetical protein